jgi:hypothetical protein
MLMRRKLKIHRNPDNLLEIKQHFNGVYIHTEIERENGKLSAKYYIDDTIGGWIWEGFETVSLSFFTRICLSTIYNDFRKVWEEKGGDKYLPELLRIALDNDDYYAITGDNRTWFDTAHLWDYVYETLRETEFSDEELEEISYYLTEIDYDDFVEEYKLALKDLVDKEVLQVRTLRELNHLLKNDIFRYNITELVYDYLNDKVEKAISEYEKRRKRRRKR